MPTNGSPPEHQGDLEGQSLWQMLNAPDAGEDELQRKRRLAAERAEERTKAASPDIPAANLPFAEPSIAPSPWERRKDVPAAGGADPSYVSNLQKALVDPSLLGEATLVGGDGRGEKGDFDDAVSRFYQDSTAAVVCKNHPDRASIQQCPMCSAYYCQECMVVRRGRVLCRDCATAAYVPTEDEILTAQEQGLDMPEGDIKPEEKPEFQITATWMGLEGRPANPLKRLAAMVIDMLVTRVLMLIVLGVLGLMFSHLPSPLFHLFDKADSGFAGQRVIDALFLLKPLIPWLVLFAVVDFLYYFITLSFANRTLGMSWLGCRIVTEWGEYVPFSAVALRTLVFMVCLGAPAVLIGWFFPGFRGPHDYAAGTVMINYAGVKRVDAYEAVHIKL